MATFIFELMGIVYKEDDLFGIVKTVLKDCGYTLDMETLKTNYDEFVKGNLDEPHFWKKLNFKNHTMARKLILEKVETSLDSGFVELLSNLAGHRIVVKGNIPQEWGEYVLESSGISNMVHSFIFSGTMGGDVNDGQLIAKLKEKLGTMVVIESSLDVYSKMVAAQMPTILLVRKPMKLNGIKPEVMISDLRQVEAIFKK